MYNGIGLQTARGSGTSGHIQKNLSNVGGFQGKINQAQKLQQSTSYSQVLAQFRENPTPLPRPPNADLLNHESLRKIESELFDRKRKLEKAGTHMASEIKEIIDSERRFLMADYESNKNDQF